MHILPPGKYLCLTDVSTSSRSVLVCCSAISAASRAASWEATSCSWCSLESWNPVFECTALPGLLKQLVSSLTSRAAWACAAERSCCSIASIWMPADFPFGSSCGLRRSSISLKRASSCESNLVPAASTATPHDPPYCATNLIKGPSHRSFPYLTVASNMNVFLLT